MCVERIYLMTFTLLLSNIVILLLMYVNDFYYDKFKQYYMVVLFVLTPITWIVKGYLISYFYKMGMFYVMNLANYTKLQIRRVKAVFTVYGFMQMFVLIADDFITLFLCNVFDTALDTFDYYFSIVDLFVTFIVEQMVPFNALFIAIIISYFSQERREIEDDGESLSSEEEDESQMLEEDSEQADE